MTVSRFDGRESGFSLRHGIRCETDPEVAVENVLLGVVDVTLLYRRHDFG